MDFYIYVIHNISSNKIYVGKSHDPQTRWLKHLKVSKHKRNIEKFYIHRAISKHDISNFTFTIIQSFKNESDSLNAEKYWIKYFRSNIKDFGYNLTEGGEGCSGRVVSEATRQKMREKAIGRKHSPETIEKLRAINLGRIPTNIEQLKIMNKGKKLSIEHKSNISKAKKGAQFTQEHKNNMSKVRIGKNLGSNNSFYGKHHTEANKIKSRGQNNKRSKLTNKQVLQIRNKYNFENYTQIQLADEYNISRRQINRIVRNIDWKHLRDENE